MKKALTKSFSMLSASPVRGPAASPKASPAPLHEVLPAAPAAPAASPAARPAVASPGILARRRASTMPHGLQCPVCQASFNDGPNNPKIVPCLHTICAQCIESAGPTAACPLDRTPVGSSASALPTNWIVLSGVERASLQQGKTRHCDLCDERNAESVSTRHCSHCNLHLCHLHSSSHQKSRDTKHHVLTKFSDYVASLQQEHPSGLHVARDMKPLMCAEPGHENHRLDMWCAVCEVMLCVQCALLGHRDHAISTVDDEVYGSQMQDVRSLTQGVKEKQNELNAAMNGVAVVMESLDRKADMANAQVDATIDAAVRALQTRRQDLKASIAAIHSEKRRTLDAQRQYLNERAARLQAAGDFSRQLLEQEDRQRVLSLKRFTALSLIEAPRTVDPNMWLPRQDDVVDFRDIGARALLDAAQCVGQVSALQRVRACAPKWDPARRGQDVVLVNNDSTAYRFDKRGWGGVLGTYVMSMGTYVLMLHVENVASNTLVGVAYNDVNLNDGATRRNVVMNEKGELWVFGEKKGVFPGASLASGDTVRVEIDMDAKEVAFKTKDGGHICSAGNLRASVRAFVALGNADALVSFCTS